MNQNPEQLAGDRIDEQRTACRWIMQHKTSIHLHASLGMAVRKYQAAIGPADYVLFADKKPVGIIEAKRAGEGLHLTVHENQSHNCGKVRSRRFSTARGLNAMHCILTAMKEHYG